MNKFYMGQRVRITGTDYSSMHLQPGATGTIVAGCGPRMFGVRMDTGVPDDPTGEGWAFDDFQLEPESPEAKA